MQVAPLKGPLLARAGLIDQLHASMPHHTGKRSCRSTKESSSRCSTGAVRTIHVPWCSSLDLATTHTYTISLHFSSLMIFTSSELLAGDTAHPACLDLGIIRRQIMTSVLGHAMTWRCSTLWVSARRSLSDTPLLARS